MRALALLPLVVLLAAAEKPQPKQLLPKPANTAQQCLATCARTYYQCQSGDDQQACSPRWMACRAACR